MKKIVFVLCIILTLGVKVYAVTVPQTLNIGLVYNSVSSNNININFGGGVYISSSDGQALYQNAANLNVTIKKSLLGGVDALVNEQTVATSASGLTLRPMTGHFKINNISYRGTVIANRINGGEINIIDNVDINDYVRGVVAKEIGSSSPAEALKAQAVCARNYAVSSLNKHKANGFDLCITEHCQVYGGVNAEAASVNAAVDGTANVVVTYDGKIAGLYFAASTGGYTESVEYVWGNKVAYLQAVPSPNENPNAIYMSWTYETTPEQATKSLSSYKLGNITNIEILEQTPRGVTTKLKVTGTAGERTFNLESCRTLFGYSALRSQAYSMQKVGGGGGTASDVYAIGANGVKTQLTGETFNVKKASGIESILLNAFWAISNSGKQSIGTQSISGGLQPEKFVFTGRGWGHLVGMSQEGAKAMAKNGATYQQILKHYYTGVTIE